jgi:hypothetical protein
MAGAALGIVRLRRWASNWHLWLKKAFAVIFIVIIALQVQQGLHYHVYKLHESFVFNHVLALHTRDVKDVLALVPPTASVGAEEHLLPYLAHRQAPVIRPAWVEDIQPEYIVCDELYDKELTEVLRRGECLGVRLFGRRAIEFYDPRQWEVSAIRGCTYSGYEQVYRRGSLAVLAKEGIRFTEGKAQNAD